MPSAPNSIENRPTAIMDLAQAEILRCNVGLSVVVGYRSLNSRLLARFTITVTTERS